MKEESDKQKLTLSINKEVIIKAKEEGINISNITEKVLGLITNENTQDALIKIYEHFFDVLKPYLRKYGTQMEVGKISKSPIIFDGESLSYAGRETKYVDMGNLLGNSYLFGGIGQLADRGKRIPITEDVVRTTVVPKIIEYLHPPNIILENFLTAIAHAAEHNKEKMKQFEFALRLVKAFSEEK